MAELEPLFPTLLYRAGLSSQFNAELESAVLALAAADRSGIEWCSANNYKGYTSYASVSDLPARAPAFAELVRQLDQHVAAFCEAEFDMGARQLTLDTIWVNVMKTGAVHGSHFHPHCVVSGTYYVSVPPGSGSIVFEDPRLGFMMAAPPRKPGNGPARQTLVPLRPEPGTVLLWESWLRHSVETCNAHTPRISISFNYRLV